MSIGMPDDGPGAAIRFERVGHTYPGAHAPTLAEVDLAIPEGELCVVVGPTGSGKSTLLGAINGLVPHFTGGTLRGRVTVEGRDTAVHRPHDLAEVVGVVGQDPLAGFVTDVVEDELAYAMEQLAVPPAAMRKRVEETLDLLGIAELRRRALVDLSGGQQQRVAIGAALTPQPRVLVLDEPTSALDPNAAEEVLAAITRLVHDLGVTVVVAEHRLERVVQYADRVVALDGRGSVLSGPPGEVLAGSPLAPPVMALAEVAGWSPPPLSVRDARRLAAPLRNRLTPPAVHAHGESGSGGPVLLSARGITVRHGHAGEVLAVRDVDMDLLAGRVVALMGRNGSGKSSLLWALQGSGTRHSGTVQLQGADPASMPRSKARHAVALVPQSPTDLLYLTTVDGECERADLECGARPGTTRAWLDRLVDGIDGTSNPRDLSEGQRLALALSVQLVGRAPVVLLDEPTRGLDHSAKERLGGELRTLAAQGRSVVVATHDVEFVACWADEVTVMAEGEVVAHGPTAEVITASAAFAPQVARIMHPEPWLTVQQVTDALAMSQPKSLRDPEP